MRQVIPATSWPSGDVKPIAISPSSPDELSRLHHLTFEERIDDFGAYRMAAVQLADGQEARLVKHEDEEEVGTLIFVDSAADVPATLVTLVKALGIAMGDLLWTPDHASREYAPA